MNKIYFFSDKGNKKISFLIAIIVFILSLYSIHFYPTGLNDDDVFFYFSIAYRFVNQGISSFDGLSITNGYHPFWMFLLYIFCLPLKILGIKSVTTFSIFFSLLISLIWYLIAREGSNLFKLIILGLSFRSTYGMETALGCLIIIYIFKISIYEGSKKYFPFIKSLLVFLLVLTRIDFIVPLIILYFEKNTNREKFIHLISLLSGITSNLLFNYQLTSNIFTVSSYLKITSRFKNIIGNLHWNLTSEILIYSLLFNSFVLLFFFSSLKKLFNKSKIEINITKNYILFSLSSQSFLIIHLFLSQIRWWYIIPTLISNLYLLDYLIQNYPYLGRNLILGLSYKNFAITSFLTSLILSVYIFVGFFDHSLKNREFINKAREIINKDGPVYVFDSSGIISWNFMPKISVINGDGLVNSFDYVDNYLRGDKPLYDYFLKNNIMYYVNNSDSKCPINNTFNCEQVFKNAKKILTSNSELRIINFKLYKLD